MIVSLFFFVLCVTASHSLVMSQWLFSPHSGINNIRSALTIVSLSHTIFPVCAAP
jgi:hypothetical protein